MFRGGQGIGPRVSTEESGITGRVEVIGPVGRIAAGDYRELQRAVCDIDHACRHTNGIEIDDAGDPVIAEDEVAGVPVSMSDAYGPLFETGVVGGSGGFVIGMKKKLDESGQFGFVAGETVVRSEGGADGAETGSHSVGVVIISRRHRELGGDIAGRGDLMKSSQDGAGVVGLRGRLLIGLPGYELEQLVEVVFETEGIESSVARGNESGGGKVGIGKALLNAMGESDAIRGGAIQRAAFEKELASVADDADLRTAARPAGELGDGFDGAEVVMAEGDGEFRGLKGFSLSVLQTEVQSREALHAPCVSTHGS